jgi:hypothetical protein
MGNKYNSNIYRAKDMEKFFDGEDSPNAEENQEMSTEETP